MRTEVLLDMLNQAISRVAIYVLFALISLLASDSFIRGQFSLFNFGNYCFAIYIFITVIFYFLFKSFIFSFQKLFFITILILTSLCYMLSDTIAMKLFQFNKDKIESIGMSELNRLGNPSIILFYGIFPDKLEITDFRQIPLTNITGSIHYYDIVLGKWVISG